MHSTSSICSTTSLTYMASRSQLSTSRRTTLTKVDRDSIVSSWTFKKILVQMVPILQFTLSTFNPFRLSRRFFHTTQRPIPENAVVLVYWFLRRLLWIWYLITRDTDKCSAQTGQCPPKRSTYPRVPAWRVQPYDGRWNWSLLPNGRGKWP